MSASTMQAAFITDFGGPEVIQVGTLPVPSLGADEVLVRVRAAAVDRVDTYVRAGTFDTAHAFPLVIGRDAWGEVAAVGTAVSGFTVGQAVWTNSMGYDGRPGVTAEYAAVPANRLFPMPAGVSSEAWLALLHPGATAAVIMNQVLALPAGQRVLIEGGAGHVGQLLIQCAVAAGHTVIATANPRDFALIRQLGAKPVDYAVGWEKGLTAPVGAIVDTSGRVPLQLNVDQLAIGGALVAIAALMPQPVTLNLPQFYMKRQRLVGFVISHATLAELTAADQWLVAHAQQLAPLAVRTLTLQEAAEAHRLVVDSSEKRRLIIEI